MSVGALQTGKGVRTWKPAWSTSSARSPHWEPTNHKRDGCKACTRCGKNPYHDRGQCPTGNATCRKCGKKGHFQAVCRSAKVGGVQTDLPSDLIDPILGAVGDSIPDSDDPWAVKLTLEGRPVTLSIDTGAEVTVISDEIWREIGQPTLTAPQRSLRGPNAKSIQSRGKFKGVLIFEDRKAQEQIYVVSGLTKPLLGRPAIEQLHLVERGASVISPRTPRERFPALFEGLGKLEGEYTIQLREGAKPFTLSTPWQYPSWNQ